MLENTLRKFDHTNGCGIRVDESACWSVMSAVRSMKITGRANASETAISMAWLAMAISIRLRLTPRREPAGVGDGRL